MTDHKFGEDVPNRENGVPERLWFIDKQTGERAVGLRLKRGRSTVRDVWTAMVRFDGKGGALWRFNERENC